MVDWLLTQNVFVMAYDVINTEKDKQQVKEHGSLLPRPIFYSFTMTIALPLSLHLCYKVKKCQSS